MPSAICWFFVSMQRGLQYNLKYATDFNLQQKRDQQE